MPDKEDWKVTRFLQQFNVLSYGAIHKVARLGYMRQRKIQNRFLFRAPSLLC